MNWSEEYSKRKSQKSLDDLMQDFLNSPKTLIKVVLAILIVLGGASSFYTVQPEESAVLLRLGRYLMTAEPGLHFKIPFGVDTVYKEKTRTVQQESFGFNGESFSDTKTSPFSRFSSQSFSRSPRALDAESLMLTGDLNVGDVEWVVHYKISDLKSYLFNVRDPQKNIRDISQATMRRVVGDRSVNDLLTIGRTQIAGEAKLLTQQILDDYEMGVTIEDVILQDVNPPEAVKPSFNEVNAAKQEQEQAINKAEEYYNKIIPESKGKAEEQISKAEGYAAAVLNTAKGDANKFSNVLREYKKAPEVTRTRLYLEMVESLLKRFKFLTIVDPDIKGVLPVYTNEQTSSLTVTKRK